MEGLQLTIFLIFELLFLELKKTIKVLKTFAIFALVKALISAAGQYYKFDLALVHNKSENEKPKIQSPTRPFLNLKPINRCLEFNTKPEMDLHKKLEEYILRSENERLFQLQNEYQLLLLERDQLLREREELVRMSEILLLETLALRLRIQSHFLKSQCVQIEESRISIDYCDLEASTPDDSSDSDSENENQEHMHATNGKVKRIIQEGEQEETDSEEDN